MKRVARILGPIACALGVAACASSSRDTRGVTNSQPAYGTPHCHVGGEVCRWDSQCCSGRCYVDTGCNG